MTEPVRLAISTCPNDTFAFCGIIEQRVPLDGLEFQMELLDIETLNQGMAQRRFDVGKVSFSAMLWHSDDWIVLPSGAALGFGVGPLLLAAEAGTVPNDSQQLTLCPGAMTTAALLFKAFHGKTEVEHVEFSRIIPALQHRKADFGVCIHEARFTWQNAGVYLVEDLGERWERETGSPLPLGGIVAHKSMPSDKLQCVQQIIRASIEWGMENPALTLDTMRRHAQEFDDEILMKHVELYVNQWTLDLGTTGSRALDCLAEVAGKTSGFPSAEINVLESID